LPLAVGKMNKKIDIISASVRISFLFLPALEK